MTDNTAQIERNENDIKALWGAIDDIKTMMMFRLPLWATMLIALLSGTCGFLFRAIMS